MFIPRVKLCILFCNQFAFNLFGTLSPLLSVRRWVITAALHPAKRGVSQLRGHYLDSYWTAIFTCGPEGRHVHSSQDQIQRSGLPSYACSEVMLQTTGDYRWADSRYQTCDGAGRCWVTEKKMILMLCLKLQIWNFKTPRKTKHEQIKSINLWYVNQRKCIIKLPALPSWRTSVLQHTMCPKWVGLICWVLFVACHPPLS